MTMPQLLDGRIEVLVLRDYKPLEVIGVFGRLRVLFSLPTSRTSSIT